MQSTRLPWEKLRAVNKKKLYPLASKFNELPFRGPGYFNPHKDGNERKSVEQLPKRRIVNIMLSSSSILGDLSPQYPIIPLTIWGLSLNRGIWPATCLKFCVRSHKIT